MTITFAGRLRELRVAKDWTQGRLAEEAGLTQHWVSHFECGRREPSLEILRKLCAALDISPEELVELLKIEP